MENCFKITKLWDHGEVELLGVFGSDEEIEKAARISYGQGTRPTSKTKELLRYLMRHGHTSPFEQAVLKFRLKMPIFVMRQHIRHRTASINEYSGRYSEMIEDMYLPDTIYKQSTSNKQGSGEEHEDSPEIRGLLDNCLKASYKAYKILLDKGVSKEQARMILPVANYTECVWQINLHNFFHYLRLRTDDHAQREIREMANVMRDLAEPFFPESFSAWHDYEKFSKKLSQMDISLLRDSIRGQLQGDRLAYNMSQREWNDFFEWYRNL